MKAKTPLRYASLKNWLRIVKNWFFSPKGDVFASMKAVFWNKTVLGFWTVQELALRHKAGRTGRQGRRPQPSWWCFYCFFQSDSLTKVEFLNYQLQK